jgi:hypothetical protein
LSEKGFILTDKPPAVKQQHLSLLILSFGLLLGAFVRFLPTLMVGYPVTDGGLFYEMVEALQANQYVLPAFVSYNGIEIPFAYPPLGFYITGAVSDFTHMPLIEAFRWVPAASSILFTIAFYPLASTMLRSEFKGALATVFFALLPRSISWYVMGGGVTRAPGTLFMLLTLFGACKLFTQPSKKYLLLTILFGSGVVLSHPEAAMHTAALCAAMWLFYGRSKEGMKNAMLTALGILLLTSPFFATVIAHHGLDPYLNAAQTGFQSPLAWVALLTGSFADEKFVTLISALALLGLIAAFLRREFLLIVFLFLPAAIDPRSAASISTFAWAMLAAIAFADIVLPGVYTLTKKDHTDLDFEENWHIYFMKSAGVKIALSALIFYAFSGAMLSVQVYPKISLTKSDRDAMAWVAENVPSQSRFVILTGGSEAFSDSVSEWFPVLGKSVSLAAIQGYEWMPDNLFQKRMADYYRLQACMNRTLECVEEWASASGQDFDYILVSQDGLEDSENPLVSSLKESANYTPLYEKGDAAVFRAGK